jgi:hypothetical protein
VALELFGVVIIKRPGHIVDDGICRNISLVHGHLDILHSDSIGHFQKRDHETW